MKILIDVGHPADVWVFKEFTKAMQERNHDLLFTAREKDVTIDLLRHFGFDYVSFGRHRRSTAGKLFGLAKFDILMLRSSARFKPDLYLSHGSMYAAQVSRLLGKPHIALEDTGNKEQIRLYLPFTSLILTPDVIGKNLGAKQVKYPGYHELAYLLPRYFKPDRKILEDLGLDAGQKYSVVRFVSWEASHDRGIKGIPIGLRRRLIGILAEKTKVLISAEGPLPEELERYRLRVHPAKVHHVLSFAEIYVGEGASMAAECGVLGTPAIYVNPLVTGYCRDLERYGLVFNLTDEPGIRGKIGEILNRPRSKEYFGLKREALLRDKVDLTELLIWTVAHYPVDAAQMQKKVEGMSRRMPAP